MIQAAGTASAKVLRWQRAGHTPEAARRCVARGRVGGANEALTLEVAQGLPHSQAGG